MNNSKLIKSSIAHRFIVYIVLFSSFITIITTAIQLYRDYNSDLNLIQIELQQIENVHQDSLASALWASNTQLLTTIVNGILEIRDIQYIEIRDEQKLWVKAGEIVGNDNIQRLYPMFYKHREKDILIGELLINVSLNGVYQRLYDTVWVVLISNAVKTSLVAIFIYFLFYKLIARHLTTISNFSEEHDPFTNNILLSLQRKNKKYDEFDVVVKSINEMHTRLHEQITEINKQKQYLSQTLDSIGDAVITTDNKGRVTRLNPVAEKLTGWANNEALNLPLKTIFPIVDASTRETIVNPVEKVLVTGETVYLSNHTTLIAKNGEEFQIADSAAPILDNKKISGMVLVFNDVTEQYKNRQALQDSEEKFHTLAKVVPVGIFKTDVEGNCTYVNEKWCELAGIPVEQAIAGGWADGLHPDDMDQVSNAWKNLISEGCIFKEEYRFKQSGCIFWVMGEAIAEFDENGDVIGYVGTITDISSRKNTETALKESDKKLHLIHSQIPGVVFQFKIDPDGKRSLPYASSAVESHIGLTAETVMDDVEKWFEMTHPDDLSGLEKSIVESMEKMSVWNWEGRFIRKDGDMIWLSGTSTPERLQDGSTLWNGVFLNVTERVLADETIRRSQKMDALGKLTGGIAHDYNNMLGVVLGYAELLKAQLSNQPKLKKYVDQIHHAGERGAKLTKKLLSFSKNKSSTVERLNINTMLSGEQHMLEKTLTARIKLDLDLQSDLWIVCLDESELEDAILNMSINAMHAIKNNGQLTIQTSNETINDVEGKALELEPGDYVRLSISDSGSGMLETTKEKIFDPFYSTKGEKGTGLGLSQVYGFVMRSGGAIKVDSMLEQGSEFSLFFPRSLGVEGSQQLSGKEESRGGNGKATILVVDDELALLDLTCEILSQHGYQVFSAEGAKQALEVLKLERIDVLLSDIIMPDMDGYTLASIVMEKYPDIKIQLASGFTGDQHVDNVLSENLLQKPYRTKDLLNRISCLLQ